jgi:putative phosphoribosyl transferase
LCESLLAGGTNARNVAIVVVHRRSELDERAPVFADRADAGRAVASMLRDLNLVDPVVLAVPAGGVPVAVEIARANAWPLEVAVVSKITLPWNTEAGYGAVAFDGTVRLDASFVAAVGLDQSHVDEGIAKTRTKVERRVRRLSGGVPHVAGRTAILVDDGLASGMTMEVAVAAVRALGASCVVVAVPTAHARAVERLGARVDHVVCPNIRSRTPYGVADAYERWQDVPEVVADELLRPFRSRERPWASD